MIVTPLTVIILLLSMFEIGRGFHRIMQERIGIRSGLIWALAWAVVGVVAVYPDLLNGLLELAQMENRLAFAILLSVLFLLALVFSLTSRLEHAERAVLRAHQELAITNARLDQLAAASR